MCITQLCFLSYCTRNTLSLISSVRDIHHLSAFFVCHRVQSPIVASTSTPTLDISLTRTPGQGCGRNYVVLEIVHSAGGNRMFLFRSL